MLQIFFPIQGTNVEQARTLIQQAQLKVISVDDFSMAAEAAVKLALMVNAANSLDLDITFKAKEKPTETSKCDTSK